MEKPIILLSTSLGAEKNYKKAFEKHGFLPCAKYLPCDIGFDALVLCGGGDIDPSFYGEANCGSYPADIDRDRAELSLFEKYFTHRKPIFGICRGCQLVNVALGGKLIQHLPTYSAHTQVCGADSVHTVENAKDSFLYSLYGAKMTVNSAHHQACSVLGQGLRVTQRHSDGTIEAVASDNILAFQWHPERMTCGFSHPRYTDPYLVFETFKNMIN